MYRPMSISYSRLLWHLAIIACGWAVILYAVPSALGDDRVGAARGGPSAVFAETLHDFGKIAPDGEVEHTFSVRNVGAGELVIHRVVVG